MSVDVEEVAGIAFLGGVAGGVLGGPAGALVGMVCGALLGVSLR